MDGYLREGKRRETEINGGDGKGEGGKREGKAVKRGNEKLRKGMRKEI